MAKRINVGTIILKKPVVSEEILETPVIDFDLWWATKGLKEQLKVVIKKHFQARGFLDSGKFDQGLKDFGI